MRTLPLSGHPGWASRPLSETSTFLRPASPGPARQTNQNAGPGTGSLGQDLRGSVELTSTIRKCTALLLGSAGRPATPPPVHRIGLAQAGRRPTVQVPLQDPEVGGTAAPLKGPGRRLSAQGSWGGELGAGAPAPEGQQVASTLLPCAPSQPRGTCLSVSGDLAAGRQVRDLWILGGRGREWAERSKGHPLSAGVCLWLDGMTEGHGKSEKLLQTPCLLPPGSLGAWSSPSELETTFPRRLRALWGGGGSVSPSPPPGGGFWFGPGLKRVVPAPAGGREQQWVVPTRMAPLLGSRSAWEQASSGKGEEPRGGWCPGPESLQRAPERLWGWPWAMQRASGCSGPGSPVGGPQSPFPSEPPGPLLHHQPAAGRRRRWG